MSKEQERKFTWGIFLCFSAGTLTVTAFVDAVEHGQWVSAIGMFVCSFMLFSAGFGGFKIVRSRTK